MRETWTTRDLPVLEAVIEVYDGPKDRSSYPNVSLDDVAAHTGLTIDEVRTSFKALRHNEPSFGVFTPISIVGEDGDWWASEPTGHARRTVGQWPAPMTAEQQAAALVEVLRQAEEDAPDEASKSTIRKMRDGLTSLPMQVVSALGTAAALKLSGLG